MCSLLRLKCVVLFISVEKLIQIHSTGLWQKNLSALGHLMKHERMLGMLKDNFLKYAQWKEIEFDFSTEN